jgi:molecular chaperone DnaJ
MATPDHYQTLNIRSTASQTEVKQAYRRLAKLLHPDSNRETASHDRIASVNAAYEVLGDPVSRHHYDEQQAFTAYLEGTGFSSSRGSRQERAAAAQKQHQQQQQAAQQADDALRLWLKRVYTPVNRSVYQIIQPLRDRIDDLAADPFDDALMEEFQGYLEECRAMLDRAEKTFKSLPNPPNVAGAAAPLYFCLNQVGDGLEQLEYFTRSYDDQYLHMGQELFRIAAGLRREAQSAVRSIPR